MPNVQGTKLELRSNTPLKGVLTDVWWAPTKHPEKFSDQIKLVGQWEQGVDAMGQMAYPAGLGHVYLPCSLEGELVSAGLVRRKETPAGESPRFQMLQQGVRVMVLRTEDGTKKPVHVTLVNGAQPPAPAAQAPARATNTAAPVASPPANRGPEAVEAPDPVQQRKGIRREWARATEQLRACIRISNTELLGALGYAAPPRAGDEDGEGAYRVEAAYIAALATMSNQMMIHAERTGITAYVGMTQGSDPERSRRPAAGTVDDLPFEDWAEK